MSKICLSLGTLVWKVAQILGFFRFLLYIALTNKTNSNYFSQRFIMDI